MLAFGGVSIGVLAAFVVLVVIVVVAVVLWRDVEYVVVVVVSLRACLCFVLLDRDCVGVLLAWFHNTLLLWHDEANDCT